MSDPTTLAVRVVVDVNLLVRHPFRERRQRRAVRALKQGLLIPIASRPYLQEVRRGTWLSTAAPPLSSDTQTAPAPHCADLRSGGVGGASASSGFVPRPA